ncbi:15841_t:CDS:2 [Funneliformis geosporum]|uniref:11591_t:CDS:1 n=1 Tax=Funneliformis geosporum TaxID=1117311 RepID=A0A9W4WPC7_9GLOM|nr:11591_t:CDS:2 [Funneliformis geosporum]CAI2163512.1 15841_t:CDS:2 [Funneliformis geosporum]
MDDYRRFRQQGQQGSDNSRNELFQGSTNNQYGGQPPYGGYQQPPPSEYPPPPYNNQQQPYGYGAPYGQQQENEEDVEGIKTQIKDVKQESLNSTLKSLQMIGQAENSAQSTLNKLGEQSQRINYTERQLDLADAHAERAADQAAKLKKVNGSMFGFDVSNPFNKKKREAAELARVQAMQAEQRASRENMRAGNWESQQRINEALKHGQQQSGYQSGKSSQSSRSKFQFEADDEDDAIEDHLDRNLDALSSGLTRLNAMAVASGEEIKKQNNVLDRISDKTTALDNRIVGTTHTLKKIR